MGKTRRHVSIPEKVAILRRHLIEKVPISDLCDEYQLQASQVYRWQQQLFENAETALQHGGPRAARCDENAKDRKIAALQEKVQRKNEVVAELLEEHVQLKKERGEP
jgi:transposase